MRRSEHRGIRCTKARDRVPASVQRRSRRMLERSATLTTYAERARSSADRASASGATSNHHGPSFPILFHRQTVRVTAARRDSSCCVLPYVANRGKRGNPVVTVKRRHRLRPPCGPRRQRERKVGMGRRRSDWLAGDADCPHLLRGRLYAGALRSDHPQPFGSSERLLTR
jgi:hypothetical protein